MAKKGSICFLTSSFASRHNIDNPMIGLTASILGKPILLALEQKYDAIEAHKRYSPVEGLVK